MSLEDKLAAIRKMAETRLPPEARAIMHKATEDLRASGIMERIAKVGEVAPDFTLPNAAGEPVSLAGLRARGPAVVSFYRGRW